MQLGTDLLVAVPPQAIPPSFFPLRSNKFSHPSIDLRFSKGSDAVSIAMGWTAATRSSLPRLVGTASHVQPQKAALAATASSRQASSYIRNGAADEQMRRSLQQNLRREWKTGDLYAPHDLSAAEMRKWSKRHQPTRDVFDVLSLDPLSLYKNFAVMSDCVSDMGRIRPAKETGLRPVNQRKIAKAVRRAVALGLMPSVHKHPELIKLREGRRPF